VELTGRTLVEGEAAGPVLALATPLSFWGGVDAATGLIIDRSHPARGAGLAGRILVLPRGRGSSSSSAVLAEALRRGTGPLGIVLAEPDPIIAVGAIVARRLYGTVCPVAVFDGRSVDALRTGDAVSLAALEGTARLGSRAVTLGQG
jgi:predicted aconitase with swiveling domain